MRTRLSSLASLLLAVAALSAQQPGASDPQLPIFRTQADLVRVDMYATARDGSLVTDLRSEEVEVYEDGVRQRVDTFEFVRVMGTADVAEPFDPSDRRSRVFVVFVDTYTTRLQNNRELRQALLRFLDQLLGPTDLVGLMTPEMPASELTLGRRTTVISDLANDDRWTGSQERGTDPTLFAWENCYGRGGGGSGRGGGGGGTGARPPTGTGGIPDAGDIERRFPVASSAEPPDESDGGGGRTSGGGGSGSGGFGGGGGGGFGGGGGGNPLGAMRARHEGKSTIDALTDLVTHLRTLREERKAVLLVTGGWPSANDVIPRPSAGAETDACAKARMSLDRIDLARLLRDLTRTANRANVSFYPVSSRLPRVFPSGMAARTRQQMQQRDKRTQDTIQGQLRLLATDTDGLPELKTANLTAVTDRILSDTSAYYLLGYQSTSTKTDGGFRAITVKVKRPGLSIRARPGYGGAPPASRAVTAATPRAPVVDPRVLTAFTTVERFDTRAPFWGRASSWDGPVDGGAFWFVGELGLESRTQPNWKAGGKAEIEVLAGDRSKLLSASIDVTDADAAFVLRVPAEGVVPPGDYSLRVRLTPTSGQGPPVQYTQRVTIKGMASPLGEPIYWRRGPSIRMSYVETADPRFRRNERLRIEIPAATEDGATAQLLDRTGKPLPTPIEIVRRADSSGAFHWLVVEPPMLSLAPGDYAVEVTQDGNARVVAFRVIP
jgi:VWFA-related protein